VPELPEVETTRRGLEPLTVGKQVARVLVHNASLRWPVPAALARSLPGLVVQSLGRRSKYLLMEFDRGTLIVHLGMTGHLRCVNADEKKIKHDHVEIFFSDGTVLRYHDPRRFGAILWTTEDPLRHQRLAHLGLEPFDEEFNGEYLYRLSRARSVAVKPFLMDGRVVVGVGNIYASEALFRAGILPRKIAGQVSRAAYQRLVPAVRAVLSEAIAAGGTTIRDFSDNDGRPGYFAHNLRVYGRGGQPCVTCGAVIRQARLGQRSTYFCSSCQK
jgi:formamidopyrimidine-DNA glycosylase